MLLNVNIDFDVLNVKIANNILGCHGDKRIKDAQTEGGDPSHRAIYRPIYLQTDRGGRESKRLFCYTDR